MTMTRPTTLPRPRRRTRRPVTTEPVDPTDPTNSPTTTDPTTTTNTSTTTSTTVPNADGRRTDRRRLPTDLRRLLGLPPRTAELRHVVARVGQRFGAGDEQHDAGPRRSGPLCGRGGSRLFRDRVDHRSVPDGTTAEVVSCWRLTGVLYGPPVDDSRPVGPDNPATLVNNTPGSARQTDQLALDGDSHMETRPTTAGRTNFGCESVLRPNPDDRHPLCPHRSARCGAGAHAGFERRTVLRRRQLDTRCRNRH